ncbi:MAG: hypothetical protein SO128_13200 [Clostridium cadaveris]|uniref:hypothetical protein n=1 Tax=Clostridium cadaveris TaxID=1529 RepID=UPI002A8E8DDA|nr:hypothetical protein [Clostridium cadaveris]
MIKLSKEHHNYLISILDDHLKKRIINVLMIENNNYMYNADDDLELDLYDYLQDKQVEFGFDKDYNPNEDWEKIQKIIDEVYNQIEA